MKAEVSPRLKLYTGESRCFLSFLHVETFTFDKLSSSSSSKKGDEAGASLDVLGAKYAY